MSQQRTVSTKQALGRTYPATNVPGDVLSGYTAGVFTDTSETSERDALRFHWRKNEADEIETFRFARVLFGLAPSPYLLEAVLESHFDAWAEKYPDEVARLHRSMYVDDLLTGGQTVQQVQRRKERAQEILHDTTFELHKWNSNIPQLEKAASSEALQEQSYAKQMFMV